MGANVAKISYIIDYYDKEFNGCDCCQKCLSLALALGADAQDGRGDVEAAAPVPGVGEEPHIAAANGDFVDGTDVAGHAQDAAHAPVLVTYLDAQVGHGPQVALAVEGYRLDV